MSQIAEIRAREILDSRGWPTIEVEIVLRSGTRAVASVPSGASVGTREALESRDGDALRFQGRGVQRAVSVIMTSVSERLVGMCVSDQAVIDQTLIQLDGTAHRSHLGANTMLAVSLAAARAASAHAKLPLYRYLGDVGATLLPVPFMNVINGGAHAHNGLDIQEFMIVPFGFSCFRDSLLAGIDIYHQLHKALQAKNQGTAVGDEGGFCEGFVSHRYCCDLLMQAIVSAGFRPGIDVGLALDCASSSFFVDEHYVLHERDDPLTRAEFVDYLVALVDDYPIVAIEDGMAEDDWQGWHLLTQRLTHRVQLVGDDLFVTNVEWIRKGIQAGIANSALIKMNQIGTLTETFDAIHLLQRHAYRGIVSHRSGETNDDFVADLAVSSHFGQIKVGAPNRGERVAKYNRLLRIEEDLGPSAFFTGGAFCYTA